jgi:hypothetical protein
MSCRRWLVVCVGALLLGCNPPDPDLTTELPPPGDLSPFEPLGLAMGPSCASLDCHGQPGRNLRLYDAHGLRLAPGDVSGEGTTTPDELLASERSVLGLEPDMTNRVLMEKGVDPQRLTLVRKARGVEVHKGGNVWPEGSDGDRCLVTWLASSTDSAACARTVTQFTVAE